MSQSKFCEDPSAIFTLGNNIAPGAKSTLIDWDRWYWLNLTNVWPTWVVITVPPCLCVRPVVPVWFNLSFTSAAVEYHREA